MFFVCSWTSSFVVMSVSFISFMSLVVIVFYVYALNQKKQKGNIKLMANYVSKWTRPSCAKLSAWEAGSSYSIGPSPYYSIGYQCIRIYTTISPEISVGGDHRWYPILSQMQCPVNYASSRLTPQLIISLLYKYGQ